MSRTGIILFIFYFQVFYCAWLLRCKKATLPIYSLIVKMAACPTICRRQAKNVHGATLKTELLRISPSVTVIPAAVADAGALASLVQENVAYLKKYLPKVATLTTVEACTVHLRHVLEDGEQHEVAEWHIIVSGKLCGAIRLNKIDLDNHKASIGYYISESCQGQGLATSSVRAVLAYCFDKLSFNRIELQCGSENLASQQVAKRLGFTWEGMLHQAELLDGEYIDLFVYGLLREDFRLRAAAAPD